LDFVALDQVIIRQGGITSENGWTIVFISGNIPKFICVQTSLGQITHDNNDSKGINNVK